MGVPRRHGRNLSAALTLMLCFAMAKGSESVGMARQEEEPGFMSGKRAEVDRLEQVAADRWRLAGLGSSPPTCRLRCGRCFPCRPVHITIQPGRSLPLEYYPEAWRCKCGNKLFMP